MTHAKGLVLLFAACRARRKGSLAPAPAARRDPSRCSTSSFQPKDRDVYSSNSSRNPRRALLCGIDRLGAALSISYCSYYVVQSVSRKGDCQRCSVHNGTVLAACGLVYLTTLGCLGIRQSRPSHYWLFQSLTTKCVPFMAAALLLQSPDRSVVRYWFRYYRSSKI